MSGRVAIVGAGPGDPGLITLKAAERLRSAQAVVYDALVNPELLRLAPAAARRIFVGKRDGLHRASQARINRLLVALARRGLEVVRLKGGDPLLFGRGGEEISALAAAGVAWEVVPGVSSCLAAPAAAGIPVTDRRASSMLTIVTGHGCAGAEGSGPVVDWAALPRGGTLVILMGLARLAPICRSLIELGWDPRTPAALLSQVGWPGERLATSPLSHLAETACALGVAAPAVVVIGEVVGLSERFAALTAPAAAGRN